MKYNYIIVGQGLAGTVMAYTLLAKGKSVVVFNEETGKEAYNASAGLFNPITGKRMTKTWKAEVIFPFLIQFYLGLERFLNTRFLHLMPIYKPFSSIKEQNDWLAKAEENDYKEYMQPVFPGSEYAPYIKTEFGGFITRHSGYIEVVKLVETFRHYLKSQGLYQNGKVTVNDLKIDSDRVSIGAINASKVIFCEGISATENTLFNWLPFSPLKGETLDLEIEGNKKDVIFNKAGFLVPLENNLYKAGSTYERNYTDDQPSVKGKDEISRKINTFFNLPYKIVKHQAGIRPAMTDRRPVAGVHPMHETIAIFNGLGTKGVSLAPYFAEELFQLLEKSIATDPEVKPDRFSS